MLVPLAIRRQISIHALRKESDLRKLDRVIKREVFQSTLSVRRAT